MFSVSQQTNVISAILMGVLLFLLTVGLPVVYQTAKNIQQSERKAENKTDNPYSNSTEEKAPSTNNTIVNEEFTHQVHYDVQLPAVQVSMAYIHAHEATYIAYHGKLHCPPPNC